MGFIIYKNLADEQLIHLINNGDDQACEYMILKYLRLVNQKAHQYFLVGAERDDIVQEGIIGLFKAIRDYKPDKGSQFSSFADLCITRHIQSAIKTATRKKNQPLNDSVSLTQDMDEEEKPRLNIADARPSPEAYVIEQESMEYLMKNLTKALSSYEIEIFRIYLTGKSYTEIAKTTGKNEKSVDNAVQRIKKKLMALIKEMDK